MQLTSPAAVGVGRVLGRLEQARPLYVVPPLCIVSWAVTLGFALAAKHNGWLYYTGGDGTYYWTMPWALGHHLLPATTISYGLPVFVWPLTLIFGSTVLPALPFYVIAQVVVLGALAVIGMYGIGTHIGGRLFGAFTAFAWAIAPLVSHVFFYKRVHERFDSLALPGILGLNNLADYPSLVLTILIAWLVLRVLDRRRWNDVLLAGTLCGFLLVVKPSNGFFVPAPILALLVARRWRETAGFLAAMIPALVTLAIWKDAGLGQIPLFGSEAVHVAAGTSFGGTVHHKFSHYITFSWSAFNGNLGEIREYGWSLRLAEWLPIAGLIGAARRGIPHAVLLGLWCADYMLVKGGSDGASVYEWSYFRLTMPGFPAYVLLTCCIVYLIPGLGRHWQPLATRMARLRPTPLFVTALVVLSAYPLVLVLAHGGAPGNRVVLDTSNNLAVSDNDLHVKVVQTPSGPSLRWQQPDVGRTKVGYVVFRGKDSGCAPGGRECLFTEQALRLVHALNFPAWQVGPGIYRVGLVAGPHISRNDGDMMLLSPPIRVR